MGSKLKELNVALNVLQTLRDPHIDYHVIVDLGQRIHAYTGSFAGPLRALNEQLALRGIDTTGTPVGIVTAVLERLDAHGRFWVYNAAGTEMIGGPFLTEDAGWDAIQHRGQWSWDNTQFADSHIGAEHFAVVEKSESESLELLANVTHVATLRVDLEANGKDG